SVSALGSMPCGPVSIVPDCPDLPASIAAAIAEALFAPRALALLLASSLAWALALAEAVASCRALRALTDDTTPVPIAAAALTAVLTASHVAAVHPKLIPV